MMAGLMTDLLENINIPPCIWFESGDKRNSITSIISGILFAIGWWFIIDAAAVYPTLMSGAYHVCGIFGSISLIMVNSVSNAQVRGDAYEGGCMGPRGARIWLFLGFVMGFVSVIASCKVLVADLVSAKKVDHHWPGAALFLQNLFICIASLLYKFGRSEDMW